MISGRLETSQSYYHRGYKGRIHGLKVVDVALQCSLEAHCLASEAVLSRLTVKYESWCVGMSHPRPGEGREPHLSPTHFWATLHKRKRGRPKRRFMDAVKGDMQVVGVTEEGAEDRGHWRRVICCGDL
ncbi:hypothetical protein O3P69_018707 [Scylla paramamosain]|uniref:Uncharacterized protein n=1 Tax=Scylla paramamosain TaxID=85552 RepID=A0AAW0SRE8_SCYPA